MKPGTARIVSAFLMFAFVMLIFPMAMLPEPVNYVFAALFLLTPLADCVILLVFWRCSYCRRGLPLQGMVGMEYCPYCGTRIE